MKRIMKWSMTLLAGLLLWPAASSAQSADDIAFDKEIDPNGVFPVVNSHKYPNTMTVTTQVIIDDETLGTDAIIAVFAGNEIRGKERPVNDNEKLAYLTVYGDNNTTLTFKVWHGGTEYECSQTLTFENESNVGSPTAPFIVGFSHPKDISEAVITLSTNSLTYNGASQVPEISGVTLEGKLVDDFTVSYMTDEGTTAIEQNAIRNAGTYTIVVTGKGKYTGSASETFDITKAALTISADDKTMVYGGELPELTVSYDGFVVGEDKRVLTKQPTVTTEATASSAVGTYDITVGGAEAGNYEISYRKGTLAITAKGAAISFTSSVLKKRFGDAPFTNSVKNTGDGQVSYTSSDTEVAEVNENTGEVTIKGTGFTFIIATVANGTNATYDQNTAQYILTVNSMNSVLDVTTDQEVYTYNGKVQIPVLTVKAGEKQLTLGSDYSLTGSLTATDAGSYTIVASPRGNYSGDPTIISWMIQKAPLTITAEDKAMTAGAARPELTVIYQGFVDGESEAVLTRRPTLTTEATASSPAGTYVITVSGAEAKNYATTYVNGTLTIRNMKGDVNGDRKVDVTDIVDVANYIKKNPPEGFDMDAADVDNNGVVDNKDIEGIVEIIMGGMSPLENVQ